MVLVEVVRYVGVGVALVGAFVTAPSGTKLLVKDGLAALHTARGWAARVIPWLRRSATVQGVTGHATGTVSFGATAHGEVWADVPDGPLEDQIDALRQRTDSLRHRITYVQTEHGKQIRDVRQGLDSANAEHREAIADLRRRHDEQEAEGARVYAAGLPLIGLGILLSGLPDQAVRYLAVSLPLLVLTAAALVLTAARLRREATTTTS